MKDNEIEAVLRLALEALDGLYLPGELGRVNAAITALRQAIDAAEQHKQAQTEANERSEVEPVAVEGWKLVPVKPTPEMCTAGYLAHDKWPNHLCDNRQELHLSFSEPRWTAMIDAAPTPPQRPVAQPHKWVEPREWRGLTDEEISALAFNSGDEESAIYAAMDLLKEKNQ